MKTLNFTNSFTQKFSDPLLNVTVFKNALARELQDRLVFYSENLYNTHQMSKNPSGDGRYRKRFLNTTTPKPIQEIINELDSHMKVFQGIPDQHIGNILTYNLPNTFIQPHRDDYGALQLRINLLASKEDLGGNPIINGFLYKIESGDAWAFSPSSCLHGSSYIITSSRINLSMGWNFNSQEDYLNAFVSLSS